MKPLFQYFKTNGENENHCSFIFIKLQNNPLVRDVFFILLGSNYSSRSTVQLHKHNTTKLTKTIVETANTFIKI